jgi:SAM-dependent methyltransferase
LRVCVGQMYNGSKISYIYAMQPISNYIISGGESGKSRLNTLANTLHPFTLQLLRHIGLSEGMSFLDNGCGGGHVAIMAANIVGNNGQVVAVDFDESILALAQQDAVLQNLPQIEFGCIDAYELPFTAKFDMAYSRFLLTHLNNPLLALQKMARSVKPGGTIIVEDIHFSGHYAYPYNSAFQQYLALYSKAVQLKGGDAEIGPTLPGLFKTAGISNIHFDTIQPAFTHGEGKSIAYLTLDRIKHSLIENQLVTEEELQTLLHALKQLAEETNSIISLPRIFRVWGQVEV